jgi:hypothetical protein
MNMDKLSWSERTELEARIEKLERELRLARCMAKLDLFNRSMGILNGLIDSMFGGWFGWWPFCTKRRVERMLAQILDYPPHLVRMRISK